MFRSTTIPALGLALACCGAEPDEDPCGRVYCIWPNYIVSSPMYSAFDGVHAYSIAPHIPSAAPESQDSDPLLAATIKWELDPTFVEESEFPYEVAALKLTTKKAGKTSVKFTGETLSGRPVNGKSDLTISQADADAWAVGDERFRAGVSGAWSYAVAPQGEGLCGLGVSLVFPAVTPCSSCHDDVNNTSSGSTPIRPDAYSDEELIDIVATGKKPAGASFTSFVLRDVAMPDCVFGEIHSWNLSQAELEGMVWKLRSVPPNMD